MLRKRGNGYPAARCSVWCVLSLVVGVGLVTPLAARTWTDVTGKHTMEGEFVTFKEGRVILDIEGNASKSVPMSKLSKNDQAFVRKLLRERREKDLPKKTPRGSTDPANPQTAPRATLTSTETIQPATYQSRHFVLHTDVTRPEAKILLGELETVLTNMAAYWQRPPTKQIKIFVVRDPKQWPAESLDPHGRMKIERSEGVTLTSGYVVTPKNGAKANPEVKKLKDATSVVYSCANIGVAQHEAVHAYCGQTFGWTGPTWYSEGMAEMGQYWVQGSRAVNTPQIVVDFLKNSPHKSAIAIVNEQQITGDSWQNYTQRWALCHMLNHNTNYSGRFRAIGQAIVDGQKINYKELFGPQARHIEFEYRFFVEHIDIGYRVDLCSWDWGKRFLPIASGKTRTTKIRAARGWQPTGVRVKAGNKIDFSATGRWKIDDGPSTNAEGAPSGNGRLVGVVMSDWELGEPFELGRHDTWTAATDGDLYLRCRDAWDAMKDNSGTIAVKLRGHDPDNPLPAPSD